MRTFPKRSVGHVRMYDGLDIFEFAGRVRPVPLSASDVDKLKFPPRRQTLRIQALSPTQGEFQPQARRGTQEGALVLVQASLRMQECKPEKTLQEVKPSNNAWPTNAA